MGASNCDLAAYGLDGLGKMSKGAGLAMQGMGQMFAITGVGAPVGAALIGSGSLFRTGGWALTFDTDGVGYMDKALDSYDYSFDLPNDYVLGKEPKE